jgi:hypothetical protein
VAAGAVAAATTPRSAATINARLRRRRIANLATAASLLIGAGALAAWVVTADDSGRWAVVQGPHTSFVGRLSAGDLTFQIASVSPDPERPATAGWQWFGGESLRPPGSPLADASPWSRVGLITTLEVIPYSDGVGVATGDPTVVSQLFVATSCRSFVVPLWLVSLGAAVLPVRWTARHVRERLRRQRTREGRCGACGYDLRGSTGRCPECGTHPDAAAAGEPSAVGS